MIPDFKSIGKGNSQYLKKQNMEELLTFMHLKAFKSENDCTKYYNKWITVKKKKNWANHDLKNVYYQKTFLGLVITGRTKWGVNAKKSYHLFYFIELKTALYLSLEKLTDPLQVRRIMCNTKAKCHYAIEKRQFCTWFIFGLYVNFLKTNSFYLFF